MLFISEPRYVPRIWGSLSVPGMETRIGEVWWLFHNEDASSRLRNTSSGTLTTVTRKVSEGGLPGDKFYPVLLKTLHTADKLSVQVHPGINGGELRKEETWIVLSAGSNAWMMGGLKDTDRNRFLDLLRQGRVEEILQRINLRKGDVYHLPPGTVHALGPGLEILEAQSNCDVTYRLYDWGRSGIDGKFRELHIEKGIEAVDWHSGGKPVPAGKESRLSGLKLGSDYIISDIRGTSVINIPGGALLFLASGLVEIRDNRIKSPSCLVADMDGGKLLLDGSGFLIEPGGG